MNYDTDFLCLPHLTPAPVWLQLGGFTIWTDHIDPTAGNFLITYIKQNMTFSLTIDTKSCAIQYPATLTLIVLQ